MLLTEKQRDALTELINIAFSRTANSLSELTGDRILLEPPKVDILPIENISKKLGEELNGEVATVHQIFTGPVAGDALLMLDYHGAVRLASIVAGEEEIEVDYLTPSLKEVIMELGNILLNACLGMFGNLLQLHITFSVPKIHLDELNAILDTLVISQEELKYALIAVTRFRIKDSSIKGYLVIILGVASLEKLLESLDKLG
ncbi:MAG: chemotaxis protein CheC [Dictyoglomus sp.]|nr:chemotaxis protein CheC [Dictyoglomus sp.]MDW8189204.1 chemotaxis protein CheC [Dictyoglomus sp.]